LRKPNRLAGIKKIVQGVVLAADREVDALRQMNMIRNDERVLVSIFCEGDGTRLVGLLREGLLG
jgi:hypothetical protein